MKKKLSYIEKQYEELFQEEYLNDQDFEERIRQHKVKIAKYQVKTTTAGKFVDVDIYPTWSDGKSSGEAKRLRTKAQQERYNHKKRCKHFESLLNANFDNGGGWYTLTFDDEHLPKEYEQSKHAVVNFIRRLNYYCERNNLKDIKYAYSIEYNDDQKGIRVHCHLITNFCDRDKLESMWQKGRTNGRRLQPDDKGLVGLAWYFTKDSKDDKDIKRVHKKTWCSSKNLTKPTVDFKKKVTRRNAENMLRSREYLEAWVAKEYPEYYIVDDESVKTYYNELCAGFYINIKLRLRQ